MSTYENNGLNLHEVSYYIDLMNCFVLRENALNCLHYLNAFIEYHNSF